MDEGVWDRAEGLRGDKAGQPPIHRAPNRCIENESVTPPILTRNPKLYVSLLTQLHSNRCHHWAKVTAPILPGIAFAGKAQEEQLLPTCKPSNARAADIPF